MLVQLTSVLPETLARFRIPLETEAFALHVSMVKPKSFIAPGKPSPPTKSSTNLLVTVPLVTVISKDWSVFTLPSFTLKVTAWVPTLATVGVPESTLVVVLKLNQAGFTGAL